MTSVRLFLVMVLGLLLTACAATVTPPAPPQEPRAVQVLEHGRHTSVVLTRADNSRVRYAYGDWAWYAENRTGIWSGFRALALPSRSAFGRQELPPERPGEYLEPVVGVGMSAIHRFEAEAAAVDALLDALDRLYHQRLDQAHESALYNLVFVPHPRRYRFGFNSNHMVAEWLRELGFSVRGSPAVGGWQIETVPVR